MLSYNYDLILVGRIVTNSCLILFFQFRTFYLLCMVSGRFHWSEICQLGNIYPEQRILSFGLYLHCLLSIKFIAIHLMNHMCTPLPWSAIVTPPSRHSPARWYLRTLQREDDCCCVQPTATTPY